jgi:E3 ubiquitin-protein ligase TRIP12
LVDPTLANSLSKLQAYGVARREIEGNITMSPTEKEAALSDLTIHGAHLEDLALDFTVPGYDIELKVSAVCKHSLGATLMFILSSPAVGIFL